MTKFADELQANAKHLRERAKAALAVETASSARFKSFFCIVGPHQHGVATKKIRQRTRKCVYPVSFGPQIG